jgi:CRP-like cAMP-binding protein
MGVGKPPEPSAQWAPGSYLDRLAPQTRDALLALGTRRTFETGRRLLSEGAEDSHVELLCRGFVKVTALAEGREALLSIRMAGDIVGETALFTGRPRTATVTTCGPVTTMVITHAAFQRFMDEHPDAARHLTAIMSERLWWANQRRTEFATYPADVRLARVLAQIASACGLPTPDGIVIGVELSQPELATMIGVAEATIQKALRDLRRRGLIRTGYRRITILDIDALRTMGETGPPHSTEQAAGPH